MKKFKYLALVFILALLFIYIYDNYIYYKIPYNPIAEYSTETLSNFYITKNLSKGEEVTIKSGDLNTCSLILNYFSDLKLLPLKNKVAWQEISEIDNSTYFTGMLKFNQSNNLFIKDIYLDNLTIVYISSDIPDFRGGYYKIVGSEFDYNYIYNLINHQSSDKEEF